MPQPRHSLAASRRLCHSRRTRTHARVLHMPAQLMVAGPMWRAHRQALVAPGLSRLIMASGGASLAARPSGVCAAPSAPSPISLRRHPHRPPSMMHAGHTNYSGAHVQQCNLSTSGLVAMTSAQHAEGRQFDPGWVYSQNLCQLEECYATDTCNLLLFQSR